jgi:hypothetical protein
MAMTNRPVLDERHSTLSPVLVTETGDTNTNKVSNSRASSEHEWIARIASQKYYTTQVLCTLQSSGTVIAIRLTTESPRHGNAALNRLKAKAKQTILRAIDYREQNGDPVDNLDGLMNAVAGDVERWQEIIDEPYG